MIVEGILPAGIAMTGHRLTQAGGVAGHEQSAVFHLAQAAKKALSSFIVLPVDTARGTSLAAEAKGDDSVMPGRNRVQNDLGPIQNWTAALTIKNAETEQTTDRTVARLISCSA